MAYEKYLLITMHSILVDTTCKLVNKQQENMFLLLIVLEIQSYLGDFVG